uniref:SRCR domain-containing protein n=1 Tax=Leptobrachium leishanense TaxID=445787 RepID=A0A8C5PQC0_9ANUR
SAKIWEKMYQPILSICPLSRYEYLLMSKYITLCLVVVFLKLVSDNDMCSGRVDLLHAGQWGTLCNSHWDLPAANVLCRQLHCGIAQSLPKGGQFGKGDGTVWNDKFHCSGTESHLSECSSTALGYSTDVIVYLHIDVFGSWFMLLVRRMFLHKIYLDIFSCSPVESRRLRLAAGLGRCSGRVEVYHQGKWGTVCDDHWDQREAEVVCKQLGCGHAISATTMAHHGRGSGKIWLDDLKCAGNESVLWECNSTAWGTEPDISKTSKAETFSLPTQMSPGRHDFNMPPDGQQFTDLRLVGGTHACEGRLEIYYNGTWGSVCENRFVSDTVSVICSQLGCGSNGKAMGRFEYGPGIEPYWLDDIECRKGDQSLWQCPSYSWSQKSCMYTEIAQIKCKSNDIFSHEYDRLRLIGGQNNCSGRVEIFYQGVWGTVCDDSWDMNDAEVVCRQLGCGSAQAAVGEAMFGYGKGPIWMDEVNCKGNEEALHDCSSLPWNTSDCRHKEDAGVSCKGKFYSWFLLNDRHSELILRFTLSVLPLRYCVPFGLSVCTYIISWSSSAWSASFPYVAASILQSGFDDIVPIGSSAEAGLPVCHSVRHIEAKCFLPSVTDLNGYKIQSTDAASPCFQCTTTFWHTWLTPSNERHSQAI